MSELNLTFTDSTYTTGNPPSVGTLKTDLTAIELGHNAHEADVANPHSVTAAQVGAATAADITAHAADTSTHGVSEVADAADLTTHEADTSTHGAAVIADASLLPTKDGWMAVSDSWAYASADAPTFTITVPSGAASIYGVGMKIKLTQTTVKYFIITAVADTVLTVYGGTDYTLANAAISAISYSVQKAPLGFPLNPTKWTVVVTDASQRTQSSPTQNAWYYSGLGSINISIPIGVWNTEGRANLGAADTAATNNGVTQLTLSNVDNAESDSSLTVGHYINGASGTIQLLAPVFIKGVIVAVTKTSYYLIARTTSSGITSIELRGDINSTIIKAVCAYL